MSTDAIVTLERLRCIRESDGTGHSEPYIWPVLLWIDENTLATPSLVGVTAPVLGNARVVIKNDMRAGETADIPRSVGVLRVRFEEGLTVRRMILAVALWEEDETPEAAMRAGFQAFSRELRAALADNLFALGSATEEEQKAIIETIKTRVKTRVESAIENSLTSWQKTRVFVGTLNLDDIINSDFASFADLVPTRIILTFRAGASDVYLIQGNLQVRPVRVDLCQTEVDSVKVAQSAVNGVDAEIRQLQDDLQHASPADKPGILAEIKRLREEDLASAQDALEDARRALQVCRNRTQSVLTPERILEPEPILQVVEKEIQGFRTKTFFNGDETEMITIASDGISTLVAIPKMAIGHGNQMGDDEYKCLKECVKIEDPDKRLQCVVLCPVTKKYQILMF